MVVVYSICWGQRCSGQVLGKDGFHFFGSPRVEYLTKEIIKHYNT